MHDISLVQDILPWPVLSSSFTSLIFRKLWLKLMITFNSKCLMVLFVFLKVEPSEQAKEEEVMMDQDEGQGKMSTVKSEQTHHQAHQESKAHKNAYPIF